MNNAPRVDSASRLIQASPAAVFRAFAEPGAMEQWLPPGNMVGEMLYLDFRDGGSYRMRLTYIDSRQGHGKTSADFDEVRVHLTKVVNEERIQQEVVFESGDPAFSGIMRVTWTLQPERAGTLVSVRTENVPAGIRPEDHAAGLNSSLENLAAFVEWNEQ